MTAKRIKIAYLCETSPRETWSHSGGNTRIFEALNKHVGDVTIIDPGWGWAEPIRKLIHILPLKLRIRLKFRTHIILSKIIARNVTKQLNQQHFDVIFCAFSFFYLLDLKLPANIPTVFTSDATWRAYKESPVGQAFGNHRITNLFEPVISLAEKRVYTNTDLLLWPSQWIKDAADEIYALDQSKSHVVHWGANMPRTCRKDVTMDLEISRHKIELLFVGRNWWMKGGATAVETLKVLLDRGINAHLTVIGCLPPEEFNHPKVTAYQQLWKHKPADLEIFTNAYRKSHFFILPSYESYGFAFCEASAYGLPSLCYDVGGIPVRDTVNGCALENGVDANAFADVIERYIDVPESYHQLRESTFQFYEDHLNWDAWGERTSRLIKEVV